MREIEDPKSELGKVLEDIQKLHHEVSGQENVQKISLICYCKQEVSSLTDTLDDVSEQVTKLIDICDEVMDKKRDLDAEIGVLVKIMKKHKKISGSFEHFNAEKVSNLFKILCDLKASRLITSEYYLEVSKVLDSAKKWLHGEEPKDREGSNKKL